MKRYVTLYLKFLQLSWSSFLIYRGNLIGGTFSNITWGIINILIILFLTAKTPVVFGWTRGELIMLMGVANILLGIFYFLFTINFYEFSELINLGKLDTLLTKPIDTQFFHSCKQAAFHSISRFILGWAVVIFMIVYTHTSVTLISVAAFFFFLVFGIALHYTVWFSVITLTIWFPTLSNLLDLLYNCNDLAKYPREMYQGGREFLYILVFPYTLIMIVPLRVLLQKATPTDFLSLILTAMIFLFLSRKFFHFALKSYTSAGG